MRCWLRVSLVLSVLAAIAVGGWWYFSREQLARQWACYRVGAAPSFEQAQEELAWFERGEDREARLGELVRKWGTGNQRFDLYLARYVNGPTGSEPLRKAFCGELARRQDLLPRWAHYRNYQASLEPDRQVASIVAYFDALLSADRPGEAAITWRQILNLQAAMQSTGGEQLARGLSPGNWRDHYRQWQEVWPAELPSISRPEKPFPDWQQPAAARP